MDLETYSRQWYHNYELEEEVSQHNKTVDAKPSNYSVVEPSLIRIYQCLQKVCEAIENSHLSAQKGIYPVELIHNVCSYEAKNEEDQNRPKIGAITEIGKLGIIQKLDTSDSTLPFTPVFPAVPVFSYCKYYQYDHEKRRDFTLELPEFDILRQCLLNDVKSWIDPTYVKQFTRDYIHSAIICLADDESGFIF